MILNNSPQDQAILSNVGNIGEFRIRNSAKAFNILSSGLYANKVRAIIRELSCNAVDSHTDAGKIDTPFDVHLPNTLEPWFSIRDYGTGLSHDQVVNIYTTYFESTKTDSNAFIGALGLGSKSPFSYTDNFTVTAIKNGRKGIYTAFINEQGVPSIALMMEEDSNDPNGVEVKFSVNDRYDFAKFRDEARNVYKYFKLRPVVSGNADFKFANPAYKEKDIIEGVSHIGEGYTSYAVMGNICYPIEVPQADSSLGQLRHLLSCGLVMEFNIGELDFQASREGLSYIPLTINSIKNKLEKLNAKLAEYLAIEANKITNLWDRAIYLNERRNDQLWSSAVTKYVTDTKFPLANSTQNYYSFLTTFKFKTDELASKYNIVLRGFTKYRGDNTCVSLKEKSEYEKTGTVHTPYMYWNIPVEKGVYFVFNDTKLGATERAKYHWRNHTQNISQETVYVIEAYDKTKPVEKSDFLKAIYNPPTDKVLKASDLMEKVRTSGIGKNVAILRLEERSRGRWAKSWVWANGGNINEYSDNETYYYVELNGWTAVGLPADVKTIRDNLVQSKILFDTIHGVRKSDIEVVRKKKNWVNLNTMIRNTLGKMDTSNVMGLVKQSIDFKTVYKYNVFSNVNANSPYLKLYNVFKDVKDTDSDTRASIEYLCRIYNITTSQNVDPNKLISKYREEVNTIYKRYPLIKSLSGYSVDNMALAEYINLIDQTKGI